MEELVECISAGEVVNEILKRHARSYKHGRSPHDLRIAVDYRGDSRHTSLEIEPIVFYTNASGCVLYLATGRV